MTDQQTPKCYHCDSEMKKWAVPPDSTWGTEFLWVCFNDDCAYFQRGWDHMMKTQEIKASYRNSVSPETGNRSPLPCWSYDALKDQIIKD